MKIKKEEFIFRQCTADDLESILKLQDEVYGALEDKDLLRKNTVEMLAFCLEEPNYTVGAYYKGRLAAISVLYVPLESDKKEMLATSLEGIDITGVRHANYKLCLVSPEFRGNSLQRILEEKLVRKAKKLGITLLCATVSPDNVYSVRNIEGAGYKFNRQFEKYSLKRCLYYKYI
jgi:GNAT superfamily N-acetyltransferase